LNDIAIKSNNDDLVICIFLLNDNLNSEIELSSLNHLKHDVDVTIEDLSHEKLIKFKSVVFIDIFEFVVSSAST